MINDRKSVPAWHDRIPPPKPPKRAPEAIAFVIAVAERQAGQHPHPHAEDLPKIVLKSYVPEQPPLPGAVISDNIEGKQ